MNMQVRTALAGMLLLAGTGLAAGCTTARAPEAGTPPVGSAAQQVHGNVAQVMRGILFPASNVVFAAQSDDPAAVAPVQDPSLATDLLRSTYGRWTAVENSGLALAESANLLTIPGRACSNGLPAPVQNEDWVRFVADLRSAGMESYKAAQAKNQDQILDASDKITTACSACHDVYREKTPEQGGEKARCTK